MSEQAMVQSRGVVKNPNKVFKMIEHVFETNMRLVKEGKKDQKMVLCIWGQAGLCKTSLIKQSKQRGLKVNGELVHPEVVHVALAQIEESGDISGLPVTDVDSTGRTITHYAPPVWWPTKEKYGDKPGILLIDDFNRADPRILKAIMQLLQDHKTNVEELPDNWVIALTGNPTSDGDTEYMVNEIDKAILTRMLHVTLKFDKIDWAIWANQNGIDDRVITWGLAYPELIDGLKGERTNPRSVVQFAHLIKGIKNLKASEEESGIVSMCSNSTLDQEPANSFMKFAIGEFSKLVDPEEILNNWDTAEKKLDALKNKTNKASSEATDEEEKDSKDSDGKKKKTTTSTSKLRADLMGITADRLYVYIMNPDVTLEEKQFKNFISFIKRDDLIRPDMMYTLLRRLRRDATTPKQQKMFADMIRFGGTEIADKVMQIA